MKRMENDWGCYLYNVDSVHTDLVRIQTLVTQLSRIWISAMHKTVILQCK
jgi:hypothetical protein